MKMNKLTTRALSFLLASAILFTSVDMNAYAASIDVNEENTEVVETEVDETESESTEEGSTETSDDTESVTTDETTPVETDELDFVEESDEALELLNAESSEDELEGVVTGDGWTISKEGVLTFDEDVTEIAGYQFSGNAKITSVILPTTLETIGEWAFDGCKNITSIEIPESVTIIGTGAFADTGITKVVIKTKNLNLKEGGQALFKNCEISELQLPEGMKVLPRVFENTKFAGEASTLLLPASLERISDYAFDGSTGIKEIVFTGNNVQTIGEWAFNGCEKITSIEIPESVTTIGTGAFADTGITKVVIKTTKLNLKEGGTGLFKNCEISELQLPEGMKTLPQIFDETTFTGEASKIVLPRSLTSIASYAFNNSKGLKKLYLGDNVKIGDWAFYGLDNLKFYITGSKKVTYNALIRIGVSADRIFQTKSITYNLNKGIATGTYVNTFVNDDESIKVADPIREFYKFCGWYRDSKFKNGIGVRENGFTTIDVSSEKNNLTLFAKWEGPYYVITFDAGEYGTLSSSENWVELLKGKKYGELPTVNVKDEFKDSKKWMLGWYTADGELVTVDTVVTDEAKNQTLYAKYVASTKSLPAPKISIWGNEDIGDSLYGYLTDKVRISCDFEGASISYKVEYANNGLDYDEVVAENVEYVRPFALEKNGRYRVTATVSKEGYVNSTSTVEIFINELFAESDLYDPSNENAFWVTYTENDVEQIYDASAVSVPYTGAAVKLTGYKVYFGRTLLTEGKDYTVKYRNNKNAVRYNAGVKSAPSIIITGKGNYSGTIEKFFTIFKSEDAKPVNKKFLKINLSQTAFDYNGLEKTPEVTVTYNDEEVPTSDYYVTYANNINASKKAQAIITFTGVNYTGTFTTNFTINPVNIDAAIESGLVVVNEDPVTGLVQRPGSIKRFPVMSLDLIDLESGHPLKGLNLVKTATEPREYSISSKITKDAEGIATEVVTITGTGNFNGKKVITYEKIAKQDLANSIVIPAKSNQLKTLNGAYTPDTVVAPVFVNKKKNYLPTAYTIQDMFGVNIAASNFVITYEADEEGGENFTPVDNNKIYPAGTTVRMTFTAKAGKNIIYKNSKVVTYTIAEGYDIASTENMSVTVGDVVYRNVVKNYLPTVTVKDLRTGTTLRRDKDYSVVFTYTDETVVPGKKGLKKVTNVRNAGDVVENIDIVPAGTVLKAEITGKGSTYSTGSVEKFYRIGYKIADARVKVNPVFFGEKYRNVVPSHSDIDVTYKNAKLDEGNYYITSFVNNSKRGTASFVVEGRGMFVGTKKVSYTIKDRSSKYNVSYDAGLGTIAPKKKAMANTQTLLNGALSANAYVAPEGYEFAGWADEMQTELPNTVEKLNSMRAALDLPAAKTNERVLFTIDTGRHPVGSNVTLYAWYQPKTFSVSFALNGGKNVAANINKYNSVEGTKLVAPTKNKYNFAGWYYDKKFVNEVSYDEATQSWVIPANMSGNITVYAKWVSK
jgi:uncharacterized repeat protein (TIGR02543 family)